jgi:hypothetical protein
MFTLFVTPAVYTLVARDHAKERESGGSASPATPPANEGTRA